MRSTCKAGRPRGRDYGSSEATGRVWPASRLAGQRGLRAERVGSPWWGEALRQDGPSELRKCWCRKALRQPSGGFINRRVL
jgi:hypothetical protein